jgi:hypothetical protein
VCIVIVFVLKTFSNNKQNVVDNNKTAANDNDYVQPGAPATLYGGRAQQAGYDIIDPPTSTLY